MTYLYKDTQRSCQQDCVHISVIFSQFPSQTCHKLLCRRKRRLSTASSARSFTSGKSLSIALKEFLVMMVPDHNFWHLILSEDCKNFIALIFLRQLQQKQRFSYSQDTFIALLSLRIDPVYFSYCAHFISAHYFKKKSE